MKLRDQAVVVNAPRELCFEVVAAGRRIENRSDREWVVEFVTASGGREVRTVESPHPRPTPRDPLSVARRPLPDVNETISFATIDENTTRLAYRGPSHSAGDARLGDRTSSSQAVV